MAWKIAQLQSGAGDGGNDIETEQGVERKIFMQEVEEWVWGSPSQYPHSKIKALRFEVPEENYE